MEISGQRYGGPPATAVRTDHVLGIVRLRFVVRRRVVNPIDGQRRGAGAHTVNAVQTPADKKGHQRGFLVGGVAGMQREVEFLDDVLVNFKRIDRKSTRLNSSHVSI